MERQELPPNEPINQEGHPQPSPAGETSRSPDLQRAASNSLDELLLKASEAPAGEGHREPPAYDNTTDMSLGDRPSDEKPKVGPGNSSLETGDTGAPANETTQPVVAIGEGDAEERSAGTQEAVKVYRESISKTQEELIEYLAKWKTFRPGQPYPRELMQVLIRARVELGDKIMNLLKEIFPKEYIAIQKEFFDNLVVFYGRQTSGEPRIPLAEGYGLAEQDKNWLERWQSAFNRRNVSKEIASGQLQPPTTHIPQGGGKQPRPSFEGFNLNL